MTTKTDKKTRAAQKAQSALRKVTEKQAARLTEWEADDPTGLAQALATIARLCDARHDDPEVCGYASVIVGGYRKGADNPDHAATAAYARARKTVAVARSLVAWAGEGDALGLLAEVTGDPDARGALGRYAPAPDLIARWSAADMVETLTTTTPRLRQMAADWRRHEVTVREAREAGVVAPCGCGDGMSHRVSLRGISVHLAGLTKDDAGFWGLYRASKGAADGARDLFAREGLAGDPAPLAPAHAGEARTTGGDRTPVTTEHPEACALITDAEGRTRPLTVREARQATGRHSHHEGPVCAPVATRWGTTERACGHASCDAIRSDALVRAARRQDHGGEWGKVQTRGALAGPLFGHRTGSRVGHAVTPGDGVASDKAPVSPRKKARTGSTGPTTRAW